MEGNTILSKNEGLSVREMDDEILFLDPDGTSIHVADEVGGFIYHQIDGVRPLSAVLQAILDEYDVNEETARTDLFNFVQELVSKHILEIK